MARGFLSGIALGAVAVVLTAVVMSLLAPPPKSPELATETGSVAAPSGEDTQEPGTAAGGDADVVEIAPTAPPAQGTGDDLAALQDSDTRPAARPSVSGASDTLSQPATGGASPDVTPSAGGAAPAGQVGEAPATPAQADAGPEAADAPLRPSVGGATGGLQTPSGAGAAPDVSAIAEPPAVPRPGGSLAAPDAEQHPISADPAQPTQPSVGDDVAALTGAPETGAAPEVSGSDEQVAALPAESADMPAPANPDDAAATAPAAPSPGTGVGEPAQPADPAEGEAPEAAGAETPVTVPGTPSAAPVQPAPAPLQPSTPEPAEPPAPRIAALPQSGGDESGNTGPADAGPRVGTRVRPLTERGQSNTFLPGAEGEESGAAAAEEPPIRRFAAGFENAEKKPLMSIVLIDDEQSIGAEALQEFPYPLTFAVAPDDPDAIEKLARYRAAGFEVALLTDLPAAATAQDAEVSLGAALGALPETVAILEGTGSGIQGNRQLSDQVTEIALGTGRGLVTQRNGLNTVQKLAARKGVPSAVVFRDFDGVGQTPDTIRRFLDQAAFRADQEGAVVMLGRVRPGTISALILWGLQDRASRVALAPLSAVLLREE